MKQELRDNNNRLLGSIRTRGDGTHEGRNASGSLKGTYNPRTNETRDPMNKLVGKGDFLAILITQL